MPAETHVEQGPLDRQAILDLIRERLADILEVEPSSINEGDSFRDDLDADSLALIELVEALEEELGDRLFDRSSRNGALTEAGQLLYEHAGRLLRLAADAELAVRELQQVRRGRVVIGANEAAVHSLLPLLDRFARAHPQAIVDVRRVASRQMASELLNRNLDLGVLTFQPAEKGLSSVPLGTDVLVMLAHPDHPLARRRRVSWENRTDIPRGIPSTRVLPGVWRV